MLFSDLRYALRTLSKSPVFTITTILTLALGIGANTAVFSVINAVLLQALPYPHPEQLVQIREYQDNFGDMSVAYPNYEDWVRAQHSFAGLALYRSEDYNLKRRAEPQRVDGIRVSASYFRVLGVPMLRGRSFSDHEDNDRGAHVVILTESGWKNLFNNDPNAIGKSIVLDEVDYQIIGIAPSKTVDERFGDPEKIFLFTPFGTFNQALKTNRGWHPGLRVIGRIKKGVTLEQATSDLQLVARNLQQQYPATNTGSKVHLKPELEDEVKDYRNTLDFLFVVVGFVLLICCANVAGLLLVRTTTRQKEIAVRNALGANRRRIIFQLLTESLLLAFSGGLVGLIFASWGLHFLTAFIPPDAPRFKQINIDPRVLGYTFFICLLTGLAFGSWPAWKVSRSSLIKHLKSVGHTGINTREQHRSHCILVLLQVTIASIVLAGSSLLIDSFRHLQSSSLGFDPKHLLGAEITLPEQRYPDEAKEKISALTNLLHDKMQSIPGVRSAAITHSPPFSGSDNEFFFAIVGQPKPKPGSAPSSEAQLVSSDYFRTMGISILRGRSFTADDRTGKQDVIIIDERFAHRFFPNQNPIGHQICDIDDPQKTQTIIGVVSTVEHRAPGLFGSNFPLVYYPLSQAPSNRLTLLARVETDNYSYYHALAQLVQSIDPNLPLYRAQPMEKSIGEEFATQRLALSLVGLFSCLALILAAIGLYGMLAYDVVQRTREIGIRVALGAMRRSIFSLILWNGMRLAAVGLIIGLTSIFLMATPLTTAFYGVTLENPAVTSFHNPIAILVVIVLLLITTFFACWWPAQRAMKIDPIRALREE